jgi:hypothetical protein
MKMQKEPLTWTFILAGLGVLIALLNWVLPNPTELVISQDGRFSVPELPEGNDTFAPDESNMPSIISFTNDGVLPALVQSIEFRIVSDKKTPERGVFTGEGRSIDVYFYKRHSMDNGRYKLSLKPPVSVPGGEWLTLNVALIEPELRGRTYVGNIIVNYNNGKKQRIENVEVDALSSEPNELGLMEYLD